MRDVLPFPPGRPRVEHVIALVKNGDVPAALAVLESMLKASKVPSIGPDERPEVVIRLRAHLEKAVADRFQPLPRLSDSAAADRDAGYAAIREISP